MKALASVLVGSFVVTMVTSCGHSVSSARQMLLPRRTARWALLPVANYAEAPQAGERVESLLATLVRRAGVGTLDHYPPLKEDDAHLTASERQRFEESLAWARSQSYDFAITGSVVEWRYKGTLDGEPAVGLSVEVLEVATGRTVFTGSESRTGSSCDTASGTALVVLRDLFDQIGTVP